MSSDIWKKKTKRQGCSWRKGAGICCIW